MIFLQGPESAITTGLMDTETGTRTETKATIVLVPGIAVATTRGVIRDHAVVTVATVTLLGRGVPVAAAVAGEDMTVAVTVAVVAAAATAIMVAATVAVGRTLFRPDKRSASGGSSFPE